MSTSDEGYYDSFSPGLEEDKKEAPSPGTPTAAFPRDSYSGDALYELFYDPAEGPGSPSLDDDLCVSESPSGPALGAPLSMCSFHVGAEENLAPVPGPDLLSLNHILYSTSSPLDLPLRSRNWHLMAGWSKQLTWRPGLALFL